MCALLAAFPAHYVIAAEQGGQIDFQPFESRDQNIFNLIHGQALPTSAQLHKKTQSQWSTSLIITNALNIEHKQNENIYLDYESYRFNFSYQYGINDNWNLKLDIPVMHQTGGAFDAAIDDWHVLLGLPRDKRPFVENNQYKINYQKHNTSLIGLNESNSALGDIQIALARSLLNDSQKSLSLWGSLKLPTGDTDKISGNGAADFSAWLALNLQLSQNWLINTNAGVVILGKNTFKNIPLSEHALYGHIMLGWKASNSINLKVQLQGHTSYYHQSQLNILDDSYFLSFGGSIKINPCNQLDIAMNQDVKVGSSPDVGLLISWRHTSACL